MKIALFGKMRSGKNTVADVLIKTLGFKEYAFSTGIHEIINNYYPEAKAEGKPRHHLQFIGQQLRELDQDVWVKYLLNSVGETDANIVVTDGRQLNEAQILKDHGYIIIRIEADEKERIKRIKALGDKFTPDLFEHETEKQVDLVEPHVTMFNNGSIEDLEDRVINLVDFLMSVQGEVD